MAQSPRTTYLPEDTQLSPKKVREIQSLLEGGSEMVQTRSVIQYLEFTCRKSIVHQGFGVYLVLVVLLLFSVLAPRTTSTLGIHAEYCKVVLLRANTAQDLTSLSHLWEWTDTVIQHMWSSQIETDSNTPIGSIVLRQYRRRLTPCARMPSAMAYPSDVIDVQVPRMCYNYGEWDDAPIPMELTEFVRNYTNETQFKSLKYDSTLATMRGVAVTGFYRNYDPVDEQYIVNVPYDNLPTANTDKVSFYNDSMKRVKQHLRFLNESQWLRPGVAAVIAETFIANFLTRAFMHLNLVFEVHVSGHLKALMHTYPIQVRTLSEPLDCAIFVADVVLLLYPILMFIEAALILRLNHRLYRKDKFTANYFITIIPVSVGYNISTAVSLTLLLGYKFQRWHMWSNLFTKTRNEMYSNMSYLTELDVTINNMTSWVTLLCVLRTFVYLRYTTRMSIISETVITAIPDLFGIVVLYYLIIHSYTVGGLYLFGTFNAAFASITDGAFFLLQILFASTLNLTDFLAKRPATTIAFFVSYLVLSWMVLLNILVGILAAAFAAVVETHSQHRRSWKPIVVIADTLTLYRKMYVGWKHLGKFSEYVQNTIEYIDRLEEHITQDDLLPGVSHGYISLGTLLILGKDMAPSHVRHIFKMATAQRGASNAKQRSIQIFACMRENQKVAATAIANQGKFLVEIYDKFVMGAQSPLRYHDIKTIEYELVQKTLAAEGEEGRLEYFSDDEMRNVAMTLNGLAEQLENMARMQDRVDVMLQYCMKTLEELLHNDDDQLEKVSYPITPPRKDST